MGTRILGGGFSTRPSLVLLVVRQYRDTTGGIERVVDDGAGVLVRSVLEEQKKKLCAAGFSRRKHGFRKLHLEIPLIYKSMRYRIGVGSVVSIVQCSLNVTVSHELMVVPRSAQG